MALSQPFDDVSTIDFRQLRHQTKNALARIMAQVATGLTSSDACRKTARDVERRILLTAEISDALFGLTREPGPLAARLDSLCESVIGLASEGDQHITFTCSVSVDIGPLHTDTVLRIAHELLGNAVKHGMHMRLLGHIDVSIRGDVAGFVLEISDDGWGCGHTPGQGEGLSVARLLAETCNGTVTLQRVGERTVAKLLVSTDE